MSSLPNFETLSHSESNVQAKVLGVLLGDDYRACFLPRFLQRAGLEDAAGWASAGSQAIFFTQPLLAYLREQATPESADQARENINRFLGLPPAFALRRNMDGRLTHPRGWNSRYVAEMLEGNRGYVGGGEVVLLLCHRCAKT